MYRQPAPPPKSRLPLLDRVFVKTPCEASWNDMKGDDPGAVLLLVQQERLRPLRDDRRGCRSLGGLTMQPPVTAYGEEPWHGRHDTTVARIRVGEGMTVTSGLPPDVIKRIARQQFGRFHLAYKSRLRKNPQLAGNVVVRFTIGRDGRVLSASDHGSSLPDAAVVHDVVSAFMAMSFPTPEDGPIVVTFPIELTPSPSPSPPSAR